MMEACLARQVVSYKAVHPGLGQAPGWSKCCKDNLTRAVHLLWSSFCKNAFAALFSTQKHDDSFFYSTFKIIL